MKITCTFVGGPREGAVLQVSDGKPPPEITAPLANADSILVNYGQDENGKPLPAPKRATMLYTHRTVGSYHFYAPSQMSTEAMVTAILRDYRAVARGRNKIANRP
jgi:hypothetical protein